MDRTIVGIGFVLVILRIGFLLAFQVMSYLHSAYLSGEYMWVVLGPIFFGLGIRNNND